VRVCSKCGVPKPVDAYAVSAKSKGGRRSECKACVNRRQMIAQNRVGWRGSRGRVPVEVLRRLGV